MKDITAVFEDIYVPHKALIFYVSQTEETQVYIEAYDMDDKGKLINAHPLSLQETKGLSQCLASGAAMRTSHLIPKGLLPVKLLYSTPTGDGFAVWYTPARKVDLLFVDSLNIPNGKAFVPPLVWKADRTKLSLYALKTNKKPVLQTPLFHAPFFNTYDTGDICMGTVDVDMSGVDNVEAFMVKWEDYYWNSFFSHLIQTASPVKGNIVQLWQQQVNTERKFPTDVLTPNGKTLKNLLP